MSHVELVEVWNLLHAIVARQPPFAQIMIAVGAAFFIVMAIEGMRTSILAMKRAATPLSPGDDGHAHPGWRTSLMKDGPATRVYAIKPSPRPAPRAKNKPPRGSRAALLVKKG